jgi:hypothetical protein
LGVRFFSREVKEMAMEVPIIQMNHGNTRSATVMPFHAEWLKNQ